MRTIEDAVVTTGAETADMSIEDKEAEGLGKINLNLQVF